MKILLTAGVALLALAPMLPFRALASGEAPETSRMALAISQPLPGVLTGSARLATAEPAVLLFVGSGLISLGTLVRRITNERRSPGGK